MPYSDGKAFVDENAGVGYVALSIADLVAESTGDAPKIDSLERDSELIEKSYPWIYMGQSGKELAAKLNDPSEREKLGKLGSSNLYLAYSNFQGYEALTIPGTAIGEMKPAVGNRHFKVGGMQAVIDDRHFKGLDVGFYDISFVIGLEEEQQRLDRVLGAHSGVLTGLESNLPVDKKTLEKEVLQLVSKANRVYDLYSLLS
jgi:hypothetical protein